MNQGLYFVSAMVCDSVHTCRMAGGGVGEIKLGGNNFIVLSLSTVDYYDTGLL
jgi:hypothetical protein